MRLELNTPLQINFRVLSKTIPVVCSKYSLKDVEFSIVESSCDINNIELITRVINPHLAKIDLIKKKKGLVSITIGHNYKKIQNNIIPIEKHNDIYKRSEIIYIDNLNKYKNCQIYHPNLPVLIDYVTSNTLKLTYWNDINLNLFNLVVKPFKIPRHIHYTTKSKKDINFKIKKIIDNNSKKNPYYKTHIYTDKDCLTFINKHYTPREKYCFEKLKPGAFKADLFRLLVLYQMGGVYLDIGVKLNTSLDSIIKDNSAVIVRERNKIPGFWNGFMIFMPKNIFLKKAIDGIFVNIINNYYGNTVLDITGPTFLYHYKSSLPKETSYYQLCVKAKNILLNNLSIISILKDDIDLTHGLYVKYWRDKNIYDNKIKYKGF